MNFTTEDIQTIRSERKRFEETKQISNNLLEFIHSKKLFKLVVPEIFGGRQLDLPTATKVFQDASYIDGNFGWLVTVGSGGGMFVPNMTEEATKACYTSKNAVIAGSGFPAGTAESVDNGYIINGKWFYCSGSQYATTFTVTCVVENEDDNSKEILAFALEPDQVRVLGDWDAFGLKGTSSHSIEVVDQFVPKYKVFSVFEQQNEYGHPIHTFPFIMFSEASFVAVSLGIGKHFLKEVDAVLETNKNTWQNGPVNRYAFLKEKLYAEKKRWETANGAFHKNLRLAWDEHVQSGEICEELQRTFSITAKRSATTAIYCTNNLFRYIGMQMVMETNSLNQIWRDLHTASQHMFLTPNNDTESLPF